MKDIELKMGRPILSAGRQSEDFKVELSASFATEREALNFQYFLIGLIRDVTGTGKDEAAQTNIEVYREEVA